MVKIARNHGPVMLYLLSLRHAAKRQIWEVVNLSADGLLVVLLRKG